MNTFDEEILAADILALKQTVRAMALATRDAIPQESKAAKSEEICAQLLAALDAELAAVHHESENPRHMHPNRHDRARETQRNTHTAHKQFTAAVYAALPKEVNLDAFIVGAYERGCAVAFPCMNRTKQQGEGSPMSMRQVGRAAYERGDVPFICSPIEAFERDEEVLAAYPPVKPSDIDFMVVPMVAFDAHQHRLGYGGGNYDTYLPDLSPACAVVGAAFKEQCVPEVPTEPHDLPMPAIVSA